MAIPIATTTITIKGRRPQSAVDPDAEGYDTAINDDPWIIDTGVRASITSPSGLRNNTDADEVISYALRCDLVDEDITRFDSIVDETTGFEYKVSSAQHSHPTQFGLEHIIARIYLTKGLQSGGAPSVPA